MSTPTTTPPNLLNDDGTASMATMIMFSHHAFRRDINRFIRAAQRIKVGDNVDANKVRDEWKNSYRMAIHGHHTGEDTTIFPDVKNKFPELTAAIDTLTAQHHHIDPLIEQIDEAVLDIAGSENIEGLLKDLKQLLDEHLAFEESTVIPTLRDQRDFPAPPDEATADMYAQGFSWSMQGIDRSVVEQLEKMLPAMLLEKLPAARADFEVRSKEVWGDYAVSSSTTSVPERY